ncbi:MAG: hypothetical protein IJ479_01650 [Alphaproteobacteria bacterium]|nr:hypothetical protein [Alphaproteobacteria bacterium]
MTEQVDYEAGQLLEALNGKADADCCNLSADGKQLISGLGLPSERYIDMSLQNSGATYTAPANGWVEFAKSSNAANQYVSLEGRLGFRCYVPGNATNAVLSMPVRKGEVFTAYYDCGGTLNRFRFYYTEGEK